MGPIPFSIPEKFAAGIADGSLQRFGTIIKNTGTGRIIAHVQETGLAQELVGSAIGIPFSPLAAISSVGANIQLAVITKMMAVMQMLQFVNLGATIVGIGVSAVGFKAMNARFTQTQSQIKNFSDNVNHHFRELKAQNFRLHQSRVNNLLNEAHLAHSYSNPQMEWMQVSRALAEEAAFYQGEVEYLLGLQIFDSTAFRTLVQLYAICNSARIKCLMLAEELLAARDLSQLTAKQFSLIFDNLSPIELAKKSIQLEGINISQESSRLREKLTETKQLVRSIRDAQDSALTRPMLLETLLEKKISGREFIQRIECEKEQPILCLAA